MELTAADPISVAVTVPANDSDPDTPPRPAHSNPFMGFLPYTNGAHKRHYPKKDAAGETPPPAEVAYRECMRNHAAKIGGHALDGCCEFMPSPEFNISDPDSLKCAACGCHRNFHRRDPDDPAPLHRHRPPQPAPAPAPFFFASAPAHILPAAIKLPMPAPATTPAANGKKRFRTKFSEEQKGKMREFAEKFGWKVQKIEKGVIEEFCNEVGVGREVLKVWLHNHKNNNGNGRSVNGGGGDHNGGDMNQLEGVHDDHLASCGDGSSSSSG